mgnify:CR=1 FL=1
MRITRNQLRRIIKEELESALNEGLVGSWKGAHSNGPELAMTYKLTGREFPIIKRLMSVTEKFSGLPKDERADWRTWPRSTTAMRRPMSSPYPCSFLSWAERESRG